MSEIIKKGVNLNFRTIADEYGALRSRSEKLWPFFRKMLAENLYFGSPNFLRQSPVGNLGTFCSKQKYMQT